MSSYFLIYNFIVQSKLTNWICYLIYKKTMLYLQIYNLIFKFEKLENWKIEKMKMFRKKYNLI